MARRILADPLVALHFAFVAFVALGGLAVLRWPRLAWAHLPAVPASSSPAASARWRRSRTTCASWPGSKATQGLRRALPVAGALTRDTQRALGAAALAINAAIYAALWLRHRRQRRAG